MSTAVPALLLDLGNTALKWALDGTAPGAHPGFVAHGMLPLAPADTLTARWAAVVATWPLAPEVAVGCSVAGADAMSAVAQACGVPIVWQRAQARFDAPAGWHLVNGYRAPQQLGPDRWHALLAACALHPGRGLLVATAGTATTVDTVRWTGPAAARFDGGRIAPGVALMLDSLARGTARLPLADGAYAVQPDSTDSAIVTGVLDAQAGLIERAARAAGAAPWLLLSGGHAARLAPLLQNLPAVAGLSIEDNLVLRGLALRLHAER